MKSLIFATGNPHKVEEIQNRLHDWPVKLLSLKDFPLVTLHEEGETLRENALQKARTVAGACGEWALSDDTGLFVAALDGRPGIFSARYAGPKATFTENVDKLLREMEGVPSEKRGAYFECVMALAHPDGREVTVRGTIDGMISEKQRGEAGFGYDPVFYIPSAKCTFAEMSLAEKNRISHRARAFEKMRIVLREIENKGNAFGVHGA